MSHKSHISAVKRLCVVMASGQETLRAVQELLKFVPDADLRIGPDLILREKGWAALIEALENRLYPRLGRLSEPLAATPLEDTPIDAELILDLRPGSPDPGLVPHARLGVWSCGDVDAGATLGGKPRVRISLTSQTAGADGSRLVADAKVQTKWLPAHTRIFAIEKTIQLFRREWMRLGLTGEVPDHGPADDTPPQPLGLSRSVLHALRFVKEGLQRKLPAAGFRQPFTLRLGHGGPDDADIGRAKDIARPHKGLRADPFLMEYGGKTYCFFEDFPEGTTNAVIAVAQVEDDGLHDLGVVLRTDYHLSYPFVFAHDGDVYMMPETLGAKRVEIWRAVDFPMRWELQTEALEGQLFADPVVFEHAGQWWFMASRCHDSLSDFSSEIWLFSADGPLLQNLIPHPLNPVVVGSGAGRGAGRIITSNGRLLRMAQDNAGPVYGYGLRIMEITALSPTDYEERCLRHMTGPDIPGAIGCHHIDFSGGRFVADVRWP